MVLRAAPLVFSLTGVFVIENHCGGIAVDHAHLAHHFLRQGYYERALQEAERARREESVATRPRLLAALAHLGLEDVESAVEQMQGAIRIAPDNPRLFATLREICLQENRLDLARDVLRELRADFPDNWHVRAGLGWAYRGLDEEGAALELLEEAISPADNIDSGARDFALVQLGRIYLRQERFEDCAAVLQKALPGEDEEYTLLLLGECRLRQGLEEKAGLRFEEAMAASHAPAATASHIAMAYYGIGARQRAIEYYERSLRKEETPLTLNNLAWLYAEEGVQLERALDLSLRAVKSAPDNVVFLDTYAELLFLLGQRQRAIALMELALVMELPGGEQYDYLLAQLEKFRGGAAMPVLPETP